MASAVQQEVDAVAYIQHDATEQPPKLSFRLPDDTSIDVDEIDDLITVAIAGVQRAFLSRLSHKKFITSVPGLLNADRLEPVSAYEFSVPTGAPSISSSDFWAVLYAFWLRKSAHERLPIVLDPHSVSNADELAGYITNNGLGYRAPNSGISDISLDFIIVRAAFWQAAGAPADRHWLCYRSTTTTAPFPSVLAFTRGPNTVTTHPLRAPKPAPGTTIYTRYIASVGQTLSLVHIDGENSLHFDTYARWQNSERVNMGWKERGPDEKHHAYIKAKLEDPHAMGVMVLWDGELGGYAEMAWVKEDHMNSFLGGHSGDYDQGTHYLAGEDKFRGRHRFTAVMTSLKHACFLRDPRTDVVVGEPRYDLPIIPLLKTYLPQEFNQEFEMPHKRAVYFVLRRERFFQAATLY